MKSIIVSLFLFCGLQFITVGQLRTIHHPVIGNPGTDAVDIQKIVCSDTATIVWMDIYNCAGEWVNIPSRTTLQSPDGQRIYKLMGVEGMEADKQVIIPEPGYISCRLWFEPFSCEETTINYVEGEGTGTWFLGDIHLYSEKEKTGSIHCLIRGEVKDRPYSSRLIINKSGADSRIIGDYIPIRNGKFEYILVCNECEAYDLAFEDEMCKGSWHGIDFFAENGEISITLYPEDKWENNKIEGGKENQALREFRRLREEAIPLAGINARRNKLIDEGKYNNKETDELMDAMFTAEDRMVKDSLYAIYNRLRIADSVYSPEALALENELLELVRRQKMWMMDYMRKYPSLACYYELKEGYDRYMQEKRLGGVPRFLEYCRVDEQVVKELVNTMYRPLYPFHSYTVAMDGYFSDLGNIQVGGRYVDFTAPDLATGEIIRLSEQIEGKLALIDLWASWCGPCRRSAMEMIPVYEKYKEKGFTVVGVARERSQIIGLNAARKDRHPWVDLLEMNDREKIWEKYGVGNSGGAQFLVDRDGKILAISPTAEEVVRILEEKIK